MENNENVVTETTENLATEEKENVATENKENTVTADKDSKATEKKKEIKFKEDNKKKVAHETGILERVVVAILCFASILLAVGFAMGLYSFNGNKITVFSAIGLVAQVIEVSSMNYDCVASLSIGILFFMFVMKNIKDSIYCAKQIGLITSNATSRKKFKETSNYVMNRYYGILFRQFLFIIISGTIKKLEWTTDLVVYFIIGISAFIFAYVVRLLMSNIDKKTCILNFAAVGLFLVAGISSCLLACKPVIQNMYYRMRQMKDINFDNFEDFVIVMYDAFVENILFIALMICLFSAIKKMFEITKNNDLFFFEASTDSKSVMVCCGIILVCRIVVDVYLKDSSAVDPDNIMSVLKYILRYNRYDLIPLSIFGLAMLLSGEDTSKKE